MNDMSDNGKEKDESSGANAEEPKKKPDLEDTLSRLLRQKGDEDNDASNEDGSGD